jgi:hypothetical protein
MRADRPSLPDLLRPSILLARDRSTYREIAVANVYVDTVDQRWADWQQRGVAHDAINRRRLVILAGFIALALASMLTRIALSGS